MDNGCNLAGRLRKLLARIAITVNYAVLCGSIMNQEHE